MATLALVAGLILGLRMGHRELRDLPGGGIGLPAQQLHAGAGVHQRVGAALGDHIADHIRRWFGFAVKQSRTFLKQMLFQIQNDFSRRKTFAAKLRGTCGMASPTPCARVEIEQLLRRKVLEFRYAKVLRLFSGDGFERTCRSEGSKKNICRREKRMQMLTIVGVSGDFPTTVNLVPEIAWVPVKGPVINPR